MDRRDVPTDLGLVLSLWLLEEPQDQDPCRRFLFEVQEQLGEARCHSGAIQAPDELDPSRIGTGEQIDEIDPLVSRKGGEGAS